MSAWTLDRLRLVAGLWEGRLAGPAGAAPPPLVCVWRGEEIAAPVIEAAGDGLWTVRLRLPAAVMTDGTHVFAIGPRGEPPLCLETLAFGDPLAGDLRSELEALRAELALLKRAFRRHLAEGE